MSHVDDAPVALLANLGERSARMLLNAGIRTIGDLRSVGPVEAFRRLRLVGERPSKVLLWAMAAGLDGRHWSSLTVEEKQALEAALRHEEGPEDPG